MKKAFGVCSSIGGRRLISRKDNEYANSLYRKLNFKPMKEEIGTIYWKLSPQKPPE